MGGLRTDLRTHLWHPGVLMPPVAPFAIAAALWLPRRGRLDDATAWWCAALLCGWSVLVSGVILSGLFPMGGDMVELAFAGVSAVLIAAVVLITVIAHALRLWSAHFPAD